MPEDRKLLTEGIRLAVAMLAGTKFDKCAALGISPTTLERWIAGVAEPSSARLSRLALKSGVDVAEIRNGGRPVKDAA